MTLYVVSKVVELVVKDSTVLSNHDQNVFNCNKNHRNWSNNQNNESDVISKVVELVLSNHD